MQREAMVDEQLDAVQLARFVVVVVDGGQRRRVRGLAVACPAFGSRTPERPGGLALRGPLWGSYWAVLWAVPHNKLMPAAVGRVGLGWAEGPSRREA